MKQNQNIATTPQTNKTPGPQKPKPANNKKKNIKKP